MYLYGQGVALNYEQARTWFKKAASTGNDDAKGWLARMETLTIAAPSPRAAN